jgi:hypothetical protein
MHIRSMTVTIDKDNSADSLAPLERGADVGLGQVPAYRIRGSVAMAMDSSDPIFVLSQGSTLGSIDIRFVNLNAVALCDVNDWSYLRNENVSFWRTSPIESREMLVGEHGTAFLPEGS